MKNEVKISFVICLFSFFIKTFVCFVVELIFQPDNDNEGE